MSRNLTQSGRLLHVGMFQDETKSSDEKQRQRREDRGRGRRSNTGGGGSALIFQRFRVRFRIERPRGALVLVLLRDLRLLPRIGIVRRRVTLPRVAKAPL